MEHLSEKRERDAKAAILQAAMETFGRHGLEGARTQAIADEARVNIALLFYYFDDKDHLYRAVLERVFADWAERLHTALDLPGSPAERLRRYAEAAYDFIAENPVRARLVQLEVIQDLKARRLAALVKKYVLPVRERSRELLEMGIAQRIFCGGDADDLITSIHGVLLGLFNSSAILQTLTGEDPLSEENIRRRRQTAVEFINRAMLVGPTS